MKKLVGAFIGFGILATAVFAAAGPVATEVPPAAPADVTAAPPAADVPVYSTDGQAIQVVVNGSFAIELKANGTTGYRWTADFDAKVLSLVDRKYTVTAPPGSVGGGGIDRFVFQALSAGKVTLAFKYSRSFEPATTPPVATRKFPVTVTAP